MTLLDKGVKLEVANLSNGEIEELRKLGFLSASGEVLEAPAAPYKSGIERIPREPIEAKDVLNEAYQYNHCVPASFTRGLRIPLGKMVLLLISGTASVAEDGHTIHKGDFRAQTWRTYRNITRLLESENASWHDIVRTTCYLRDIERDYDNFNEIRTTFFRWLGLNPLPASTGIQARLCREDLLIEIEAIAMIPADRPNPSLDGE